MQFFLDRWHGRVLLERLFWRDMIIVGTTANVVFLVTALILAAHDFPVWAYVSVFFIPLPYNFFIWQCVWTAAGRSELGQRLFVRTIASIWMLIVIVA